MSKQSIDNLTDAHLEILRLLHAGKRIMSPRYTMRPDRWRVTTPELVNNVLHYQSQAVSADAIRHLEAMGYVLIKESGIYDFLVPHPNGRRDLDVCECDTVFLTEAGRAYVEALR